MEPFKLKRTKQCDKCPWINNSDPSQIPGGYTPELHEGLRKTIANPEVDYQRLPELLNPSQPILAMSCHEHRTEEGVYCIGWLVNQLKNNNIPLRIKMLECTNAKEIETVGEQHEIFDQTLK